MADDTANLKNNFTPIQRLTGWAARHPYWVMVLLVAACGGPFLDKAVHIDDPLFVWAAQHIQKHPGNFYGFAVNWTGQTVPMSVENWNPPATSYGLAGVAAMFGWGEIYLHGAMLLVVFAALAGTFQLARMWCGRPLLATVIALAMPVFMVSATTLMCDLPMVTCWIWSMVIWERALSSGRARHYLPAVLLAGLAVLTKYSAITLLPLLPLLGILRQRKLGWWVVWLAVPAGMIGMYELLTAKIYGQGLISAAAANAAQYRFALVGGRLDKTIIGLVYLGGCLLPAALLAPFLWRREQLIPGTFVLGGVAIETMLSLPTAWLGGIPANGDTHWLVLGQMTLMMAGGLQVLLLAGMAVWRDRDTVSLTAALWIASGFIFAAVLNWTVSARSLLPLAAPVAILLVRQLDRARLPDFPPQRWLIPIFISGLFSLNLTWADAQLANSGRTAARQIAAEYPPARQRLWFEGHCALQFYLEPLGGQAVDYNNALLQTGDLLLIPGNNSNLMGPPEDSVTLLDNKTYPVCSWLGSVRADLGAGFYGAGGCLPFVLGPVPMEQYYLFQVTKPFQFSLPAGAAESAAAWTDNRLTVASDEAILRDHPEDASTHASLAEILSRQGDQTGAVRHYEASLQWQPDQPVCLNNLAWLLATSADARLRNGPEAVRRAERACELTQYKKTVFLGTLGAAYAEAGRFPEAIATAQKACANATTLGETELLQRNQELLGLYQSNQAYHEPAEKLVPDAR